MDDQETNREGRRLIVYWIAVCSLTGMALSAIYSVSPGPYRGSPIHPWHKPVHYLSAGILVAVVWAILFRSQVARFRISLSAIFVLMLMEAGYLLAIRIVNPFWAFGP
jgi:hypothetical protein